MDLINQIYCCDNLKLLTKIPDNSINLIITDILFNTSKKQVSSKNADLYYEDTFENIDAYLDYMELRFRQMHRILAENGSIYVHCDHRANAEIKILLKKVFGPKNHVNDIAWCYQGISIINARNFMKFHDSIYLFAKSKNYYFNSKAIQVKVKESTINRVKYKHVYGNPESNGYLRKSDGWKTPSNWIEIPYICSTGKERDKAGHYPTQKPISLYEIFVKASSQENDLVADFFLGSGTVLEAALKHRRKFLGCDKSPMACKIAANRLNYPVNKIKTLNSTALKNDIEPGSIMAFYEN